MSRKKKAVFNWSGGKDSALALQRVIADEEYEVISLLTTVSAASGRSSVQQIPAGLLAAQSESIGLPLYTVPISETQDYDLGMKKAVFHFKKLGVRHFIFGDIFLEDVKTYRESRLNPIGIEVVQPLWGRTSELVLSELVSSGIRSKITQTRADLLDRSFIGRNIDSDFLNQIPEGIDPCGENGEYHTFAYSGKIFKNDIPFEISEVNKISYTFKTDKGEVQTFEYWQSELSAGGKPK